MILVSDDADVKLQRALYQMRDKKTGGRCIKIAWHDTRPDAFLRLVTIINDLIDSPDGTIFECSGHDVFVLASGLTTKITDKLNATLKEQMPPSDADPAILLDTSGQWADIITYVEEKIEAAEHRALEKKQEDDKKKKERVREMIMGMQFEHELLRTLDARRSEREQVGVYLVEDDMFTRNLVANTLKAAYDMTVTGDGYTAVSRYASRAPDIVFLDIDLPDVSGLDVLCKILSIDKNAFVIMLSGNSQKENVLKAIELGAKGFIGKPFTKEKLITYIQKCPRLSSTTSKVST